MTDYTKNIKVNIIAIRAGKSVRTSTTLHFHLCDFYIGKVCNTKKREDLMLSGMSNYRAWLEKAVQAWVKEQPIQQQQRLETTLLSLIYDEGVKKGMSEQPSLF